MENYKSLCLSVLLLATLCHLSSACGDVGCSEVFGAASKFNLYASGNITLRGVSAAGTIAVGGSASISADSSLTLNQLSLMVKGDLSIGGGLISLTGSVAVGGKRSQNILLLDGSAVSSVVPLDFASATSHLVSLSTCWAGLPLTGLSDLEYGKKVFTCQGPNLVQVFKMLAEEWDLFCSFGFRFLGCSVNQTIVINVAGGLISIHNGLGTYGSISPSKVVFNFYEATSITIQNTAVVSTVLAPLAVLSGTSAPLCQAFVKGLIGDSSLKFVDTYAGAKCYFDGCLPLPRVNIPATVAPSPPTPTPLPVLPGMC